MGSKRWQLWTTANTARQAFTLIELLVVGAIIVILVALTLFAMNRVESHTKETKTRATIQKIDVAMQQIFVSLEREFAIIRSRIALNYPSPAFSEADRQKIAAHLIRDLMRMEMPQSWAEVYNSNAPTTPLGPLTMTHNGRFYSVLSPGVEFTSDPYSAQWTPARYSEYPLLSYYWEAYQTTAPYRAATRKEPNRAALLFLIIQNLNPEALEAFHGSEIADTDGDGLLEFVDAWGKPIQFLRWAPAFPGSDLQYDVLKEAGYALRANPTENKDWWDAKGERLQGAMEKASAEHCDPLDMRVNVVDGVVGWFLYPLIYSAGPDGKYDITVEAVGSNGLPVSPTAGAGGILDPFAFPFGMPGDYDGNGVLNHFDNIHNHQWYRSF